LFTASHFKTKRGCPNLTPKRPNVTSFKAVQPLTTAVQPLIRAPDPSLIEMRKLGC